MLNHPGTATSGPLYDNATTQLFEFDDNGNFVRELGQGVYGLGYWHSARYDRYDNLWIVDKGTNAVTRFKSGGLRDDEPRTASGRIRAARAHCAGGRPARRRLLQRADRRRVGSGRQHLRQRRLRQLTRRQVRQAWQLDQVVGHLRHGAGTDQAAAQPGRRPQRTRLCSRPYEPAHPERSWDGSENRAASSDSSTGRTGSRAVPTRPCTWPT